MLFFTSRTLECFQCREIIFTIDIVILIIEQRLKVCQINGLNGFLFFIPLPCFYFFMVMFDVKGKRGSEFWQGSGGCLGPQKLLG